MAEQENIIDTKDDQGLLFCRQQLPVNKAFLELALKNIEGVAVMLGFKPRKVMNLQVVLEEVFINAVKNYYEPVVGNEHIDIEYYVKEENLIISVREKGIPFKIDRHMMEPKENLDIEQAGLGMRLIRGMVDECYFIMHGRQGKEVRLIKKLPDGQSERIKSIMSVQPANPSRITITQPVIRRAVSDDAPDICRLAWRCFKYSGEGYIYDAAKIKESIRDGKLVPFLAADPETGNIFYSSALNYLAPMFPECELVFSDARYRCGSISHTMLNTILDYSEKHGDYGVFSQCVTVNTASQKISEMVGSVPCSLVMGQWVSSLQNNLPGSVNQGKSTLLNTYTAFNRTERVVYLPSRHCSMVSDIYQWMRLPRIVKEASPVLPKTDEDVQINEECNSAFITLNRINAASYDTIKNTLHRGCRHKLDSFYVHISIEDPAAPAIVNACESLGFFFAGIIPHAHNGADRLIMQYLNVDIDFSLIRLHGENARQLSKYVIAEYHRVNPGLDGNRD